MLHCPLRVTPQQMRFLHWFLSFCNSSFISWSSNFWMSTWCFIMNFPFKWKTGMSYLYLSYHDEFSGRVISTSCKINCDRKDVSTSWTLKKQYLLVLWSIFFSEKQGCFLDAFGFIFLCCRQLTILYAATILGCMSAKDSLPSPYQYSQSSVQNHSPVSTNHNKCAAGNTKACYTAF